MTSADTAVETKTLATDGAEVVYDVHGPLPAADGRPPLFMIGQPMDAGGFSTLVTLFPDRTVITYDPRGGVGRTRRTDENTEVRPEVQAADLHAIIVELGASVDVLASSGGAVTGLALVTGYPGDVVTLVAHEPPLLALLPDAAAAFAAEQVAQRAYQDRGWGAGMASFIGLTSWQGEFTDAYLQAPPPDPAQFGLPTADDGNRTDPLLSGIANAITAYRPDIAALTASDTRLVIAAGVESRNGLTWRTTEALAAALDLPLTEFPSHHSGFMGGEFGHAGQPEAFAARLREVLDQTS
jgi:pimeloyl-ACP methyl ester carboxylesterase